MDLDELITAARTDQILAGQHGDTQAEAEAAARIDALLDQR